MKIASNILFICDTERGRAELWLVLHYEWTSEMVILYSYLTAL